MKQLLLNALLCVILTLPFSMVMGQVNPVTEFPWNETFEGTWSGDPVAPEGWKQIIISGNSKYKQGDWPVNNGTYAATTDTDDGIGHAMLITPALDLGTNPDQKYRLRFSIRGGGWYTAIDLRIKIGENNTSIDDFTEPVRFFEGYDIPTGFEEQVIDLSAFSGVKYIAFILENDEEENPQNFTIDDISVEAIPNTPAIAFSESTMGFGPIAAASSVSKTVTITNDGGADLIITGTNATAPFTCDFTGTLVPGQSTDATITYAPTEKGNTEQALTFNITGNYSGNASISLQGNAFGEGYFFESFETTVPPENWTNETLAGDEWSKGYYDGYHGNHSIELSDNYIGKSTEASKARLIIPEVSFENDATLEFYARRDDDNPPVLKIQYSSNGTDFTDLETIETTEEYVYHCVNLATSGLTHGYIAFYGETAESNSTINLDAVIHPPFYVGELPPATANPVPANEALNLLATTTLSWDAITSAEGYKIMMGETNPPTQQVANVTTNSAEITMEFGKTYFWQVIPFNTTGDATDCPVWSYTTMADPTISTFPYTQDFEGAIIPPMGWENKADVLWETGTEAHNGTQCAMVKDDTYGTAIMQTPLIQLPQEYQISFWWKDDHMTKAASNAKYNMNSPLIKYKDTTFFEVSVDTGKNWSCIDTLCPIVTMSEYAVARHDLSSYGDKTILLRWREVLGDVNYTSGVGLDDILIEEKPITPVADINLTQWDAETTGVNTSVNSNNIFTITNIGAEKLKISNTEFSGSAYTTNLDNSIELAHGQSADFGFTFAPLTAGTHNETFTITTNASGVNNGIITINLSGEAIVMEVINGDFENAANFSLEAHGWTILDGDQQNTYGWNSIAFPHSGDPMGFIVFNPSATTPAMTSEAIQPHGGERFIGCFSAVTPPNNDWLITPKTTLNNKTLFKAWLKTFTTNGGQYPTEKYRVLVSTTDTNPASFTAISGDEPVEAPEEQWTEISYDLSAYANQEVYVAIQCVSKDAFLFMVDDISFVDATGINNLANQNIKLYPNPAHNTINITGADNATVTISNILGEQLIQLDNTQNITTININSLPQGTYMVRILRNGQATTHKFIRIL